MVRDRRVWILWAAALVALLVWLSVAVSRRPTMRVTFLDVGDGQCTVIRTPSGRTLMVDCGTSSWRNPASVGSKLAVPYLQSQGINKIDVLVLTHPHSDHMSGIPGILRRLRTDLVLDTGEKERTPDYSRYKRAIKASGARYRHLRYGQEISMGDGVVARVVGPLPDTACQDANDRCAVLRVSFGKVAILLAADAGTEAEAEMIASGVELHAQVLQVGHHGSARSTSPEWLCAVEPSVAVIPCSSRSRYGFPSRRVMDRLASFGVRTYTTGRSGAVTVVTDGTNVQVSPFRGSR